MGFRKDAPFGRGDERPRRLAFNLPGHAHELTFSLYRKYPFLKAERTCHWLARAIEDARRSREFPLWAYVFMPDHVHLIVQARNPTYRVAAILEAIKTPVGRAAVKFIAANAPEWLPRITRQRGSRTERLFWQPGGGFDRNIDEPRTLRRMIDYIHTNPVRRGWVEHASDWRWSSAAWFAGRGSNRLDPDPIPPEWLDD